MIQILENTPHYVVCVKPQGVDSQKDLPPLLAEALQAPTETLYLVHRLDKETGGVMVLAKDAATAGLLSAQVAQHTFQKTYLAAVNGRVTPVAGEMQDLLFFDRQKNKSFVVKTRRKGVKLAKLTYEVLWQDQGVSTVKIHLHTGRTHQIRVQFASRGFPVAGDRKYGGPKWEHPHIALWSYEISFCDAHNNPVRCTCPPPEYLLTGEKG